VRRFETDQAKPSEFNWKQSEVVEMDKDLPNNGDILRRATFPFPWQGGILVALECEVWPPAEDGSKTGSVSVYFDVIPL
jgi:hypothetical protein